MDKNLVVSRNFVQVSIKSFMVSFRSLYRCFEYMYQSKTQLRAISKVIVYKILGPALRKLAIRSSAQYKVALLNLIEISFVAVFVLPLPLAASAASTLIMSFLTFKLRSLGPPRRGGHDFMSRSIINPFPSDYLSLSLISSSLLARFLLGLYTKIAAKKLASESGTIQWRISD